MNIYIKTAMAKQKMNDDSEQWQIYKYLSALVMINK